MFIIKYPNNSTNRLESSTRKQITVLFYVETGMERNKENLIRPQQQSGISSLEVPDKDINDLPTDDPDKAKSWKLITNPAEIEQKILKRNIQHFGRAEGTLFTTDLFQKEFNYEGVSKAVDSLLAGNHINSIESDDLSISATKLLQNLRNKRTLQNIPDGFSFSEFSHAIRKWRESTSTSPSGKHLGHYKCLLR